MSHRRLQKDCTICLVAGGETGGGVWDESLPPLSSGWGGACCRGRREAESDLGLQQLQEEFVHRDFAVLLDAVEVLHGLGRRLPEQGQGHEQLAGPARVLAVLAGLVVLQGLVQHVLELLNGLHVLYMHGVCDRTKHTGKHSVKMLIVAIYMKSSIKETHNENKMLLNNRSTWILIRWSQKTLSNTTLARRVC